jgi:putative hydrolase of the HAD superfamily
VSNFDTRLYSVLRGLGLADVFDSITLSSLAHAAKPAPAIFRAALEEHAVDPDEAIHVGDSPRDDVEGAREAGLRAVWLCRSGAADEARQPSRNGVTIIGSLDEVAAIVGAK